MIPRLAYVKNDAFVPGALDAYLEVKGRGVAHRWVLAAHSSQAFALNLFAPLDDEARRSVFTLLGLEAAEVDSAVYEWSDEADRLGEMGDRGRHRTQVDVMLRGLSPAGQRVVALIEVKLTESDFGWCSAYENPANPDRLVCRHDGFFGGQPASCFQLNNHGHGHRRYLEYLTSAGVVADKPAATSLAGRGCALRRSVNQPMRNLALGAVLLGDGEADQVVYAVCAPRRHPTIWRRFSEVRAVFADSATLTLRSLPAELVAALAPDRGRALAARYGGGALDVAESQQEAEYLDRSPVSRAPRFNQYPSPRNGLL